MKIAGIRLIGYSPRKGLRKKTFLVLFEEKFTDDELIKLAIEEKDEQDQPGELVFWKEGELLITFDESKIIDLTDVSLTDLSNTSLLKKILRRLSI